MVGYPTTAEKGAAQRKAIQGLKQVLAFIRLAVQALATPIAGSINEFVRVIFNEKNSCTY